MRCRSIGPLLLTVAVSLVQPALAAQRAFVASYGSDAAPCSVASPCRSFAAAIAVVDAGGEVIVLDSAGYGPVTIAKSVHVAAPAGVHAAITIPSAADGITISGGTFDVTISGLTLTGTSANSGITAQHAGSLTVERVRIEGATTSISLAPTGVLRIDLRDLVLKRGTNAIVGNTVAGDIADVVADSFSDNVIDIGNDSGVTIARATITNSYAMNTVAIRANATGESLTMLTVVDCRLTNVFNGIQAFDFGGTAQVQAVGNTIMGAQGAALSAQGVGSILVASHNSVTRSAVGLLEGGGTLYTFDNNTLLLSTTDTSGAITSATYR